MLEVIKKTLYEGGFIDEVDMSLYVLVDSVDEAYDYVVKNVTC